MTEKKQPFLRIEYEKPGEDGRCNAHVGIVALGVCHAIGWHSFLESELEEYRKIDWMVVEEF